MKAMIFAAGLGTRLRPITDNIPKALLPIGGKTLLQHQIERLREAGITDIVVNVHHFADMIIDYFRQNDNFGCDISVSDERDRLLDTGGGLRKAAHLLMPDKNTAESLLACNVDILSNINIPELIAAHKPDSIATLVVSERNTQRYLIFDEENRMVGWTNIATNEVKPFNMEYNKDCMRLLAFSGMQILSPRIFELMDNVVEEKGDKFSLIDLYLSLCSDEIIRAYIPANYHMMDVGKIGQLSDAEDFAITHLK